MRASQSSLARAFFSPWVFNVSACVDGLRAMRDLLLVVALVAWLLVELLWPQLTSVKADTRDPYILILDPSGAGPVHEFDHSPMSNFFGVRHATSDAPADGNPINALADFAAGARTSAFSAFGHTPRTIGQRTGESSGGQPPPSIASSHRDRPGRRADSGTSTIRH